MKLFLVVYILLIYNYLINSYCPDDEELEKHQCKCNLIKHTIQCSSLPNQCQTCYRYQTIYFDEKVNLLPNDTFHLYQFFDNNNFFEIQFAHINNLSINTFSKLHINQDKILNIKILKYSLSRIPTKLFENLTIETNGKLNIEIFNITQSLLIIEQYAFYGIIFHLKSYFNLPEFGPKEISSRNFVPGRTSGDFSSRDKNHVGLSSQTEILLVNNHKKFYFDNG